MPNITIGKYTIRRDNEIICVSEGRVPRASFPDNSDGWKDALEFCEAVSIEPRCPHCQNKIKLVLIGFNTCSCGGRYLLMDGFYAVRKIR